MWHFSSLGFQLRSFLLSLLVLSISFTSLSKIWVKNKVQLNFKQKKINSISSIRQEVEIQFQLIHYVKKCSYGPFCLDKYFVENLIKFVEPWWLWFFYNL